MDHEDLQFRIRSMHDYRTDTDEIVRLLERCEASNLQSVVNESSKTEKSKTIFHCEFTDFLWCMEQYPESYCMELVDPKDGRIIFVVTVHVKRVHVGPRLMNMSFSRLARMDPTRRGQHLAMNLLLQSAPIITNLGLDYSQGYTSATNSPSLNLQRTALGSQRKEITSLDIFVISTESNGSSQYLKKLSQTETESLWSVSMIDWISRPILSDLRHIIGMKEYIGTYVIGDFPHGSFCAASVWQPSNIIICDDRQSLSNPCCAPFRVIFNIFESNQGAIDKRELLLSGLLDAIALDKIPYVLGHVDIKSPFNELLRQRASAISTEILSRRIISSRMQDTNDEYNNSPVWLDPRDFSALLYFSQISTSNDPSKL